MRLSDFEQDVALAHGGVWIDMEDDDGTRLLIARANNPKAVKLSERLEKPFKRLIDRNKLPKGKREAINAEVFSKTILLGWENFIGADKEAIPYSQEKAFEILMEDKYSDFYELVASLALEQETFKAQTDETIREE